MCSWEHGCCLFLLLLPPLLLPLLLLPPLLRLPAAAVS